MCGPAKAAITWPDPTVDGTDLHSLATQAERLLRMNMDRLEHEMRQVKHRNAYEPHIKQAKLLSDGMTKLLAEMRKLEESAIRKAKKMSFEEKVQVYLGLFCDLPRQHQEELIEAMTSKFNESPLQGLELLDKLN